MPSDKASYLAAHYLNADPKPSSVSKKHKKRKRVAPANDALLINDDDDDADDAWNGRDANNHDDGTLDLAGDGPVTAGTSAEFRRAKKSAWKSVGGARRTQADADAAAAAAAADAIVASAAADRLAEGRDPDDPDDPMDVDPSAAAASFAANRKAPAGARSGSEQHVPNMSDGTHAGLQSAAALSAQLEERRREECAMREELAALREEARTKKKKSKKDGDGEGGGYGEGEMILRDATGRRVDLSLRRAELRRAAAEAERAEAARQRMLVGGEVQEEETHRRREQLEAAKLMTVARGADDEEMNADMRAQRRWNDPMAEFLAADDDGGGGGGGRGGNDKQGRGGGGKKEGDSNRRRPVYKGAAPPNRYGIRPGYRWDGVDRGNGFEAERFRAINKVERNKGLEYAWQMDT